MDRIVKLTGYLLLNFFLLSGLYAQKNFDLPVAEHFYSNTLKIGESEAIFRIPQNCISYGILTINYTVYGRDILVGLEANAFEDISQSMMVAASNSAFPYRLQLDLRYRGNRLYVGQNSTNLDTAFRLRRNFSSQDSYYHLFEIKNIGQCILKSQGYGMVTFRVRIADSKGKIIDWGDEYQQLLEDDLYPGFSIVIPCLIDPLPPGSYTLQWIVQLQNDSVMHSNDPGIIVAGLELPIRVVNQTSPQPGLVIAEKMDILPPPIFPRTFYHWEEYLQAFQVHALDKNRIQGQLYLTMPGDSREIIVKLITDSGITSASWNITAIQDTSLFRMEKRIWRKNNFTNSRKIPILPILYCPENADRFTLSAESCIHRDLEEIKNLGMGPVVLKLNRSNYPSSLPLQYSLDFSRKMNLKIIPSLEINLFTDRINMQEKGFLENGLGNRNRNTKNISKMDDSVFRTFFQEWKDILYRGRDGRYLFAIQFPDKPIYDKRGKESDSPSLTSEFQFYLQSKYKNIPSLNTAWNTHYTGYSEINPERFEEWEPAIFEWDTFRSFRNVGKIYRVSEYIHQYVRTSRIGFLSSPLYGIESTLDENYYSLYGFNWLGERLGLLADHLFQKKFSRLDAIFYSSLGDRVNISNITQFAVARDIYPFYFLEYNGERFLKNLDNHPEWEQSGGWYYLPGIRARDYRARMALYPRLTEALRSGVIPGISSWNDYKHYSRFTEVQKKEIEIYRNGLSE